MAKKTASDFDVTAHTLVPKHELCSDSEKKKILERFQTEPQRFPRIPFADAAIQHLGAKEGDLIKITRMSPTAGQTVFYRVVSME